MNEFTKEEIELYVLYISYLLKKTNKNIDEIEDILRNTPEDILTYDKWYQIYQREEILKERDEKLK